jgi:N-hydroxyarylamine O-acetyltransferase
LFDVDFEMANHFTSTHPSSRFVQTLTVQLATAKGRNILRGRELTLISGNDVSNRNIDHEEELLHVLVDVFGLSFSPGVRFRGPFSSTS